MGTRHGLTPEQVEESIRFGRGVLASAGHFVRADEVERDARLALTGEISFDEAVQRAIDRATR